MPAKKLAPKGPMDILIATLSRAEKVYHTKRFAVMFEQADSDIVLEPTIHNIIYNEILLTRLQQSIQKEMALNEPNMVDVDRISKIATSIQRQNLESLNSLNLTKEKKDALNKTPQSTPLRIITGYALAWSQMNRAEKERFEKESADAMARLRKNEEDLLELIPSEVEAASIDIAEE